MAEHTKVFHPVLVTSLYSGQTMNSASSICDGNSSTYGYLKTSTSGGVGMTMRYNFSSLPSNATLVNMKVGSADCRWKISKSTVTYIWLYRIRYVSGSTNTDDTWESGSTTTRFAYRNTAAANTVYSFNTSEYSLKSLSNKTALNMAKLLQTRVVDSTTVSCVEIAVGFKCNSASSSSPANAYLNMMPITVTYSLPDNTLTFEADANGKVDRASFTGDAEQNVTVTATPKYGYAFSHWSDSTSNTNPTRTFNSTSSTTYKAIFKLATPTISFDSNGGSSCSSISVTFNDTYRNLPTPTKSGYVFKGWQVGTSSGSVTMNGSNDYAALGRSSMYTDKISVHIEAYRSNWSTISTNNEQIMSCTEGGGWGIGHGANTVGHGTEVYVAGVGYKGIDFGIASLSSGWHSFDMIFDNGVFKGYVDGVLKGTVNTGGTNISYHASNGIFIGAEAGSSPTSPGNSYFNGQLRNACITHSNELLGIVTNTTQVINPLNHTLKAVWMKIEPEFIAYIGTTNYKMSAYIGTTKVTGYVGKTQIY